ncbi:sulfatase family protein [Williamsia deligens]|uniref:Sulfatase n=1 Tax=Williamsia deligens TaxID=321325 RepID=A0ABW3G947_9NOCA|nr:sulfatase [Williamsia deligens]MCP2192639.1 Arylsulfatase A [Williamsia deligens]
MRDNVLFVHWHDLGRHLACYGAQGVVSPVLDTLAADGVLLTDAHAAAPLCSPARGALFTGRYPHSTGLIGLAHHGFEYHDDVRTLPAILSSHGWATQLYGMQHESSDPSRIGFDDWDVSDSRCDHVVARSQEWLREHGTDGPFLLTAGFFETHRPYPADEYPPEDPSAVTVPPFLPDARPVREDIAGLQASITKADAAVGRLLDTLAELALDATTWVVFITDHGVAFPRAKSTLYEAGTGVACIIRPPTARGVTPHHYDDLFSGVDLSPTILDALGLDVPDDMEGFSHATEMFGPPVDADAVRSEVFTEKTFHDSFDPIRAVRTTTHRYIENYARRPALSLPLDILDSPSALALDGSQDLPRPERELYDLRVDPLERINLADDPAHATIRDDLAARLHRWRTETGDELLDEATGTAIAAEFMRRHHAQLDTEPAREKTRSLPSRRPLGEQRELRRTARDPDRES